LRGSGCGLSCGDLATLQGGLKTMTSNFFSVAGFCVGNLVMHGIHRRDLEDRLDIKGSLRDSLTWVDPSQDTALRRLVPSAAMNQGIFLTAQQPSAVLSTKLQGSYIPTNSKFYSAVRNNHK
jgi:hypothetical protein